MFKKIFDRPNFYSMNCEISHYLPLACWDHQASARIHRQCWHQSAQLQTVPQISRWNRFICKSVSSFLVAYKATWCC